MNLSKRIKGFKVAFRGIWLSFKLGLHMKIHFVATVLVVALGVYLKISEGEWATIALAIGLVLAMEIVNTAMEDIANTVRDRMGLDYQATRDVRDLAAGAVLISAIVAVVVAGMIFVPKVLIQ